MGYPPRYQWGMLSGGWLESVRSFGVLAWFSSFLWALRNFPMISIAVAYNVGFNIHCHLVRGRKKNRKIGHQTTK